MVGQDWPRPCGAVRHSTCCGLRPARWSSSIHVANAQTDRQRSTKRRTAKERKPGQWLFWQWIVRYLTPLVAMVAWLWETPSGRLLATLEGHIGAVRAGGRAITSGRFDGVLKLWDTASLSLLRTLRADRSDRPRLRRSGRRSACTGGASQRDRQDNYDANRHHYPGSGVHARSCQSTRHDQQDHHTRGHDPVIADDEVVPEPHKRLQEVHVSCSPLVLVSWTCNGGPSASDRRRVGSPKDPHADQGRQQHER